MPRSRFVNNLFHGRLLVGWPFLFKQYRDTSISLLHYLPIREPHIAGFGEHLSREVAWCFSLELHARHAADFQFLRETRDKPTALLGKKI